MRSGEDFFQQRAADDPPSTLAVIIDTSVSSWSTVDPPDPPSSTAAADKLQSVCDQLLVFIGAFTLLHQSNRIVVLLAGGAGSCDLVIPSLRDADLLPDSFHVLSEDTLLDGLSSADPSADTEYNAGEHATASVQNALVGGVKQSLALQTDAQCSKAPLFDAALARALCVLNRARAARAAHLARTGTLSSTTASSAPDSSFQGRILLITASPDVQSQYVSTMNCIFAAQKLQIPIDAATFQKQPSTFWQQAAYLTSGVCRAVQQSDDFLQLLMTVFLIDGACRNFLALPAPDSVDFRASCLVRRTTIDDGSTCSVCLSTFETAAVKGAAMCPICGSRFAVLARGRRR